MPKPGIYRLPDGATVGTVINMTMPGQALQGGIEAQLPVVLRPGMVLDVTRTDRKNYALTVSYMKAKERMILGIPLDLQLMNEEDWDALPGIGAKTAKAIIFYRQKYGDFQSIQDLERVKGMSGGKIMKIRQFFSD
ncbi:helix-hairpin-helix domain-containing protein [Geotalea sp. SG265]|uniref:ComEA family DNA-binding protein n=1 Tax=Geotalea sp. SG265 TaxID=2922867 RepID=UPI001FAEFDEF